MNEKTPTLSPEEAAAGFAAAGSESRLAVLRSLVRAGPNGLSAGAIQKQLEIPASTLAHHLRLLEAAGLVEREKRGRDTITRVQYDLVEKLAAYLLEECCASEECCEAKPECCASGECCDAKPECCAC